MAKPRKTDAAVAAVPAAVAAVPAVPVAALTETTLFVPDDESTNAGKNAALATLLGAPWRPLAIVRVERIEIGDKGWRVVFRE